jgi:oligogalacturonide lyase
MKARSPHSRRWTRRSVLCGLAGMTLPVSGQNRASLPSESVRYTDPATELAVVRLTSPDYSSALPPYSSDAAGRSGASLIYSADRTGGWQVYRMDLKTGQSQKLTEAAALDASSVCQLFDERSICYFDGPSLRQTTLSTLRTRELYRVPEGWSHGRGLCISADGVNATFVEARERVWRLRILGLAKADAATAAEAPEVIGDPIPRPRRAGILYRRGQDDLWLVNYDGRDNRRLKIAEGGLGPADWSPDGRAVLYLRFPREPEKLNEIRELVPDSNADQLISTTSQFVSFSHNSDASVFAGASSSKAAPYILILLRVTHRELALCEHRSSDPSTVAPLFSADSQRVYFQSDRHGKPAIYTIRVDRLVEKTET